MVLSKAPRKARRNSVLTKYNRSLMIVKIAEMVLAGSKRSDVVDYIHSTYNYSIRTIDDLICEANNYAATVFTDDEKKLKLRQIATLYEDIMFDDNEMSFAKLKAADQLSKLLKFYNPDIAVVNITNLNFSKLPLEALETISKFIPEKFDE